MLADVASVAINVLSFIAFGPELSENLRPGFCEVEFIGTLHYTDRTKKFRIRSESSYKCWRYNTRILDTNQNQVNSRKSSVQLTYLVRKIDCESGRCTDQSH